MRDRRAIWGKTLADQDLNNNHNPNNDMNCFDNADFNADSEASGKVVPLGDNMPCIADYPIIE